MVYYCGDEIKPLKSYISKFLSERSADQVEEVRDVCLQIIKLLGDGNSSHNHHTGNDNGWYTERSSLSGQSNKSSQKKIGPMKKTTSKTNTNSVNVVKHNRKKSDGGYYGTNANSIKSYLGGVLKNKSTIETIRENFTSSSSSNYIHKEDTNRERSSSAKRSRKYYSIHNTNNNSILNTNHSVNYINKSAQKERSTIHHNFNIPSTNNSCITERTSSLPKPKRTPLSNRSSKYDYLSKSSCHSSSNIANTNSQTTIIPVYLDLIFTSDSSGYVYQEYDALVSFNKNYIDELDTQVRSLSLFDTKIYFQFLL